MDFVLLLIVAGCGALGFPVSIVLVVAAILTAVSAKRKFALARSYPDVGSSRIILVALLLSLANNTVFTFLSFALGRAVSLIV